MGCCSSSRGSCGTKKSGCGSKTGSCSSGCNKLDVFNWLADLPPSPNTTDWVEIRFKNTRKGFYKNVNDLKLKKGDVVAVEASPGHDIGVVSLSGDLVLRQIKKHGEPTGEPKKIYRIAKPVDIEKWETATSREDEVMIESRKICRQLGLEMKVSDIEFQGDGTKAIFYYIAKERVDFRELIKVLADRFRIRIEMKQIGARQEAGRVGGIGTCGRELCCSTWVTNFVTVTTSAARYQELSLNPQKLAGQCGKLKCCLNYELDSYMDAQKDFPGTNVVLETETGMAFHFKTDIFKRIMWYSFDSSAPVNVTPVPVDRVKEIIKLNKAGEQVETLITKEEAAKVKVAPLGFANTIEEDDLDRFSDKEDLADKKSRNKSNNNRRNINRRPRPDRRDSAEGSSESRPRPRRDSSEGRENTPRPRRNLRPRPDRANDKPNPRPADKQSDKPAAKTDEGSGKRNGGKQRHARPNNRNKQNGTKARPKKGQRPANSPKGEGNSDSPE